MTLINNAQLVKSGKNSTAPDILHFSSAGERGGNNIATKTKQTRLFISSNTSGLCRPPRNIKEEEVEDEVEWSSWVVWWNGWVLWKHHRGGGQRISIGGAGGCIVVISQVQSFSRKSNVE